MLRMFLLWFFRDMEDALGYTAVDYTTDELICEFKVAVRNKFERWL